ncbi:MAG: T9SS type A sorting domain-containing protein, partial [Rhodothermales bacterium]|nr:T9SS type A sorting domain-containing protein [Rhodothermales bacterium]
YSDVEHPASFQFERGTTVVAVDSVGFRLRGNTSRDAAKKSYKVSFNRFRVGGEFFDLEKLNLNGEHNDPTIMRAKASWDFFNSIGVPASRANHVKLYINGEYFGVYLNVEHVDEKFLDRHFGNSEGNLYKCLWPADLDYLGSSADAYRPTDDSRRPYDLKLKDDDQAAYDDLARLITVINRTEDARFVDELEKILDVNGFLRAHAATVLLGSWDSYWFLKNNFYLYFDPDTDRFEYIPFDFDNVMGVWWDGILQGMDWTTRDVYEWGHPNESRPLLERILATPALRDRYTFYMRRLLQGAFSRGSMESGILRRRDAIAELADQDPYRPLDYGFSMDDFRDGYLGPLPSHSHVVEGVLPFIDKRALSALSQFDRINVAPIISDLSVTPLSTLPLGSVEFALRVEDEQLDVVELHYWLGSPVENTVPMTRDEDLGPDMFSARIQAQETAGFIDYRVEAVDELGQRTVTRLHTMRVGNAIPLYINEFMASNQTTIQDPANEYDDWFELYNGSAEPIALAGLFATDTLGIPFKWAMPDTTIPAGSYLVIWADEDGMQGPTHANFRLARGGEVIAIFDAAGAVVDSVSFGMQTPDVSFGRLPDGGSDFASFTTPTPGSANSANVGVDPTPLPRHEIDIALYPNPSRGDLSISFSAPLSRIRISIFDVIGRRVALVQESDPTADRIVWDGRADSGARVPAGLYIVRVTGSSRSGAVTASAPIVRIH